MTVVVHVLAGCLGLVFGYAALFAAKGATVHRRSGMLCVYVMLALSVTGAVMAIGGRWQTVNVPAAVLTAYFVVTALTTVRSPVRGSRWVHIVGMLVAFAVGLMCLAFGLEALAKGGNRNGVPAFAYLRRLRIRGSPSSLASRELAGTGLRITRKGQATFLLVLTTVSVSVAVVEAQYKVPRNEFGQPDLQGVWNFSSDVPLERPKEFADKKFFTREELEKQNVARESTLDSLARLAPVEVADRIWLDYKAQAENLRTSLIVYPENGRMPQMVEGIRRVGGLAAVISGDIPGGRPVRFFFGGIGKDGPEDRGLAERCVLGPNARPPFLPGFDSNYVQIFQTTDHVVLLADTFHGTRLVPVDGRPHLGEKLRSWSGDSRGRWEGETLVVETNNFNSLTQSFNDAGTSYDKVVTERFTRVSENVLEYEATIVDAKTFQDKIVVSFPMAKTDARIYETACHEGNYSMPNTLSGARQDELAAMKPKR